MLDRDNYIDYSTLSEQKGKRRKGRRPIQGKK